MIRVFLAIAAFVLMAGDAFGQSPQTVRLCIGNNPCVPISGANPLPTSAAGGGGGAVTIADGADVAEGATTDAATTAGAAGTVSAKLRLMTTQLDVLGLQADAACSTDNGTCTIAALTKRNNQRLSSLIALLPTSLGQKTMANSFAVAIASDQSAVPASQSGTWTVQPGNTPNTSPWLFTINQGSNSAAVKAASTAPVATDPALVVAISPNTPAIATSPTPSSASTVAITPVPSTSAEASHVLKGSTCNVYSVSAINLSASTPGFLLLINATVAPTTGSAVSPLGFAPLPPSGVGSINYGDFPARFSTGCVALISSNASPFTFTSGTITGVITGQVQ